MVRGPQKINNLSVTSIYLPMSYLHIAFIISENGTKPKYRKWILMGTFIAKDHIGRFIIQEYDWQRMEETKIPIQSKVVLRRDDEIKKRKRKTILRKDNGIIHLNIPFIFIYLQTHSRKLNMYF